jgi:hypothetical protein
MANLPDLQGDLATMFSVDLLAWLSERGCTRLRFEVVEVHSEGETTFIFDVPPGSDGQSAGRLLFYGLHLDDSEEQLLRATLQANFQLQSIKSETGNRQRATEVCLVSCQALEQVLHDIRNRLNSLLMSAGVLYTAPASAERTKRFATQIEADGKSCADELGRLYQLFRSPSAVDPAVQSGTSPTDLQVAAGLQPVK